MEDISRFRRISHALRLKCPNCGKASVFYRPKFGIGRPIMHDACENCGYRFKREPEYFSGVAFLSYSLAIAEGIIAFVLAKYLIFGLTPSKLVFISLAAVLFLITWNYKFARVVWLNVHKDPS
jgi:hypothetical protein